MSVEEATKSTRTRSRIRGGSDSSASPMTRFNTSEPNYINVAYRRSMSVSEGSFKIGRKIPHRDRYFVFLSNVSPEIKVQVIFRNLVLPPDLDNHGQKFSDSILEVRNIKMLLVVRWIKDRRGIAMQKINQKFFFRMNCQIDCVGSM